MASFERIIDLMTQWEEQRSAGREPTPEELCPDDTELRAELARRIERRRRFEAPQDTIADPSAPPFPDQFPSIPGFDILGPLGRGGMGVVFLARDLALNRLIALKLLPSDRAHGEFVARFAAEGAFVASLRHPNIVQVFASGSHDGQPFLALEYMNGGSLSARRTDPRTAGGASGKGGEVGKAPAGGGGGGNSKRRKPGSPRSSIANKCLSPGRITPMQEKSSNKPGVN